MNKVPLLAALALVLGTSAAFAAHSPNLNPAFVTTEKCSYLERQFPTKDATSYSAGKQLNAEQNALSYCRTDKHKTASLGERAAHLSRAIVARS